MSTLMCIAILLYGGCSSEFDTVPRGTRDYFQTAFWEYALDMNHHFSISLIQMKKVRVWHNKYFPLLWFDNTLESGENGEHHLLMANPLVCRLCRAICAKHHLKNMLRGQCISCRWMLVKMVASVSSLLHNFFSNLLWFFNFPGWLLGVIWYVGSIV